MRYAYYPGCSLEHLASAYQNSLVSMAHLLKMELLTIPDWNCCGSIEYMSIGRIGAYALAARNLARVPKGLSDVVAPCSACYLNLKKADRIMSEKPDICGKVNEALGAGKIHYSPGRVRVRHLLDVMVNDIGLDVIEGRVTAPLSQLRVAPYYGCMAVRPEGDFDHPEHPMTMDMILEALGATVVDFSMKTYCCGGHMPRIKAATGHEILWRILKAAHAHQTDIIAVACPVCQLNLDAYQQDVNRQFNTHFNIPVLFFTQLMGLAMDLPLADLGIGRELVSAESILRRRKKTLDGPVAAPPDIARTLPMPSLKRGP